ncbi:MAG: glutathione S-transferase family protein [Proteobacteria bacterium]|nr:glutathione S-transferase family protein [Pseudomonadota bacterium]
MYTLYGMKGSGSASVEAALTALGVPHRIVETAQWQRNAAFDELLKVNPLGQIPTLLLPDGHALTESAAIHIYLADTHADAHWLPADPVARAECIRGLVFIAANCYPMITIIDYPERFVADGDGDEAVQKRIRDGTRTTLHKHWSMFADLFPATPWLSGATLGALDVYAAVVSKWSGARKHLEAERPAFFALLQRIEQEPRVAAVFARHWPPAA